MPSIHDSVSFQETHQAVFSRPAHFTGTIRISVYRSTIFAYRHDDSQDLLHDPWISVTLESCQSCTQFQSRLETGKSSAFRCLCSFVIFFAALDLHDPKKTVPRHTFKPHITALRQILVLPLHICSLILEDGIRSHSTAIASVVQSVMSSSQADQDKETILALMQLHPSLCLSRPVSPKLLCSLHLLIRSLYLLIFLAARVLRSGREATTPKISDKLAASGILTA